MKASTRAIHGRSDQSYHSAVYPIYQSSTFGVARSDDYAAIMSGEAEDAYVYSRLHNPTVSNVEERLAALEGAEAGAMFSSGMAAITAAILSVAKAGDTVIAIRPLYGGTYHFFSYTLARMGIKAVLVDPEDAYDLRRTAPDAVLVYFETPTNPTLRCVSIADVVASAREIGAEVIVDNTFASPVNQRPLELGANTVIHSATKYLGGHSDIVAGAVVTDAGRMVEVRDLLKSLGGCTSPFDAFLLDRSLKTLVARVRQHNETACQLADFFASESRVQAVHFPGLSSSPDHEIARSQMDGFGGMLAIDLGSEDAAKYFCDSLEIGLNAVSLGGVETLVTIPALSTHAKVEDDERRIAGVTPGLVRISAGLEAVEDLIADFEQALVAVY